MPAKKRSGPAFTVNFPNELRATRHGEHWWVEVDGRELSVSNDLGQHEREQLLAGGLLRYIRGRQEGTA